jgi:hypothetical protein
MNNDLTPIDTHQLAKLRAVRKAFHHITHWKPQPGDDLAGVFVGVKQEKGDHHSIVIQTRAGTVCARLTQSIAIELRRQGARLGWFVSIACEGRNPGKAANRYRVLSLPPNAEVTDTATNRRFNP